METRNNSRTLVIAAIVGLALAAALGIGFLLGGQPGGSETASTAQSAQDAQSLGGAPQSAGTDPQQGEQPVATQTPAAGNDDPPTQTPDAEEEEPTATPTATSTPTGECAYCLDGDLTLEPTPVDPCPLCNDLPLAIPVDTPPVISDISTSFCYPMLVVKFELQDADVVWFSFTHDGVTHQTLHIDADTFPGYLSKDMAYLDWGVYFVSNLRVHATDDQGHHVWSDEIPMPDPDLAC